MVLACKHGRVVDALGATTWSGWNIDENLLGINKISASQAATMNDADFRTNTVFYLYPTSMNDPAVTLAERNRHLAYGIPALTPAAGRTALGGQSFQNRSFDCNFAGDIARPNSWPSGRRYVNRWTHSDMKDVAYYYIWKFYEKVVEKGMLQ